MRSNLYYHYHLTPDASIRNLKHMRQFASSYPDIAIVQELLAQLSLYHNLTIVQKLKDDESSKMVYLQKYLRRAQMNKSSLSPLLLMLPYAHLHPKFGK